MAMTPTWVVKSCQNATARGVGDWMTTVSAVSRTEMLLDGVDVTPFRSSKEVGQLISGELN